MFPLLFLQWCGSAEQVLRRAMLQMYNGSSDLPNLFVPSEDLLYIRFLSTNSDVDTRQLRRNQISRALRPHISKCHIEKIETKINPSRALYDSVKKILRKMNDASTMFAFNLIANIPHMPIHVLSPSLRKFDVPQLPAPEQHRTKCDQTSGRDSPREMYLNKIWTTDGFLLPRKPPVQTNCYQIVRKWTQLCLQIRHKKLWLSDKSYPMLWPDSSTIKDAPETR